MKIRAVLIMAALAVIGGLASCSGGTASGPPEINYGRDVCDQCHMIISEARYAAAYRDTQGRPFAFDDIGDMMEHLDASEAVDTATAWVHDFESEDWIDVNDAWFVHSSDIETPMGGGTIAFTERTDAERHALDNGTEVVQWAHMVENIGNFSSSDGHRSGEADHGGDIQGDTHDEMTDRMTDDGEHGS